MCLVILIVLTLAVKTIFFQCNTVHTVMRGNTFTRFPSVPYYFRFKEASVDMCKCGSLGEKFVIIHNIK